MLIPFFPKARNSNIVNGDCLVRVPLAEAGRGRGRATSAPAHGDLKMAPTCHGSSHCSDVG